MDWAQTGNVITSGGIAAAGLIFIGSYQVTARWWETPVGRTLMALTGGMAALGAYTVLIYLWPHGGVAVILRCCRIAVGIAMIALLLRWTWLMLHSQRTGRRHGPG